MTPLLKMHTLGHDFIPAPIHAGGLRYHGMAPLISHVYELGLMEAEAIEQTECFAAARAVRARRGHRAGAGADACAGVVHPRGREGQGDRSGDGHPDGPVRSRLPRPRGLRDFLAGALADEEIAADRFAESMAAIPASEIDGSQPQWSVAHAQDESATPATTAATGSVTTRIEQCAEGCRGRAIIEPSPIATASPVPSRRARSGWGDVTYFRSLESRRSASGLPPV